LTITVEMKASAEGRLFGSVSRQEIAEALAKENVPVDKQHIDLKDPIKQTGAALVPIRLPAGLQAQLKVNVVAEPSNS